MTGPSKRKGDKAELEVQALLREQLGVPARRALGAGRKDDIGDITGVPNTVIQVVAWRDVAAAVRAKPVECARQALEYAKLHPTWEAWEEPFAATFVRLRGGDYRVVLTPEQWAMYWREAQ